jgi:hypothetical protein
MTAIGIVRLTVSKLLNHVETRGTAVYDRYSYDPEKRRAPFAGRDALQNGSWMVHLRRRSLLSARQLGASRKPIPS